MGLEEKREERGGRERYGRLSLFRPLLFVFGSARANQTTGDQNFRTLFDPCDPIKANATATLFDNLFSPTAPPSDPPVISSCCEKDGESVY